ncbi:MAG: EamA family transporter [Elusimicrobia bacterium]|nr:EamA family transporter [Elusimicrobiota bacterium]
MSPFGYSLLAALVWGISPLLEKYGIRSVPPHLGVVLRSAGVAAGACALFAAMPGPVRWSEMSAVSLGSFAVAGALASVLGQIFAYNALSKADVSQVAPIMGAWPLFAVVFGCLVLREPMTLQKFLGAASIVFGVWLLRF